MSYIPAELIKKKKHGEPHSPSEIEYLIREYTKGRLPDYQMSAWLMAVYFKGMHPEEVATLTRAMKLSGAVLDFSSLNAPRVDKHSTGGVGDKTSLIIGPIMAAAGVATPMIAGRGLGHTGGTLDKLQSIPGFNINLTMEKFKALVAKHHFALMGQTEEICPADRKLYALRDVTSTVDSMPLICGSIMSKKLAEDLTGLVLDVKFGSGAFMKTLDEAQSLAELLKLTGELNNVRVTAVLSTMDQPLGRFIGNALEVRECLDIMENKSSLQDGFDYYQATRELSLVLAGHMFYLAKRTASPEDGYNLASEILSGGKAHAKFLELCDYQGPADLSKLPRAAHEFQVSADRDGFVSAMDVELIGLSSLELGAGRKIASDVIDPLAGIEMNCKLGDSIKSGDTLAVLYASSSEKFEDAKEMFLQALTIDSQPPSSQQPLIAKTLLG